MVCHFCFFFFSSRRRHTRCSRDWSSDVCSSDLTHDAIELQLLDLAAKTVQPVTANGAVNVEPRWSPDGTRIAFEIGRASCREKSVDLGGRRIIKKKKKK